MSNINQDIKKGTFWVLLFAVVGGPLALVRNWLFTNYDSTGALIGDFAVLMILYNVITSFFMFGGSSVLTNFVPKINNEEDKFSFFLSYTLICISLLCVCCVLLLFFPSLISYLTNGKINQSQNIYLFFICFPVILSQITIFYLQGKYQYKLSSFLAQLPVFFYTGTILVLIIFNIPITFFKTSNSFILFLSILIVISSLIIVIFSLFPILKNIEFNRIKLILPKKFWHFSFYVHLMTLVTFVYQNIDQIFVLKIVNVRELANYFIIIQLVEVVRFIPVKIGQVLLASFSKIIHSNDQKLLADTYNEVSRIVIIINLALSIILLCYSSQLLSFFNIKGFYYQHCFAILLIGYNISNVGNVNSMILLAKNLSKPFFINNFIVVVVLTVGLYFFSPLKLLGVVTAKSLSILIGQIGLFFLIRKHFTDKIGISKDYAFSQFFMVLVAVAYILTSKFGLFAHITLSFFSLLIVYHYYNFSFKELKKKIINKS